MSETNNISATEYGFMLAETVAIKKNNYEIAKELAESRKSYAMMLKERNYLHTENTNLLMQNDILKNYIATTIQHAREVLNSIVAASNGLTTIICSEPSILGNFKKSSSMKNHSNMKKQSVSPMVRGHTIMKPIIRINKLRNLKLAGLSTYQQRISAENNSPSTMQSDESVEKQEEEDNDLENDKNEMVEENSDDSSSNSNGYISPDRFESITEEDENMDVRDEMVAENTDDASSNSDGYISPDRFETIAEEDEENMDVREEVVAENLHVSSSNNDGCVSPDKFKTIVEEDKENMGLRDNVKTNVSDYIDVVPSMAGTLVSTSFRNVNPRVSTPSQEIEALTGRVSSARQEENSPQSIINSNFNSPIAVRRRKLKRLISPNNLIIHSARKKANLESPEVSSNDTENEMYMSQTVRNKISTIRKINLEDETNVPRMTRRIMKSTKGEQKVEESLPITENDSYVPRVTRSRMKSAKGELSVPKVATRKAGTIKALETSCNATESDFGITSRNTESSTLINTFGSFDHSVAFGDNTLKSAAMSGSVQDGNVKINTLRANNSMDETIDMNALITSTPYNRNKSVFNENSSLSQDRGIKSIARSDCSVILKRMVINSPKVSSNRIITGKRGSQSKRKYMEPSQMRELLKEPSLISVCNRPMRKTKPLHLKEPSLVSKLRRA